MINVKCVVPVSGGKDSQACAKLAVETFGADKVEGLFCDTKFEHPFTYQHVDRIGEMYGIKIHKVCSGSVELQIKKHKRFPGGGARFCTEELKLWPAKRFYNDFARGNGPFEVWYGIRGDESPQRRKRYAEKVDSELYPPHEVLAKFPKGLADLGCMFRLPIINWTEQEVFDYLNDEENPLYMYGFDRVGCFPCLASGDKHKEMAFGFDEVGATNLKMCRSMEKLTGCSVFYSKSGRERNDAGCSFCAI